MTEIFSRFGQMAKKVLAKKETQKHITNANCFRFSSLANSFLQTESRKAEIMTFSEKARTVVKRC